jgi:hypothetical protein
MGLLGLFGADTEGGGILGGLGRTIRDAAPVMSAYGRGEDVGLAQMRAAKMQEQRQERLQQEMLKKQAAAMAERMGLDPALASSPETVFGIYKAQKAAEIERKNRVPREVPLEKQIWSQLTPEQRQQYIERQYLGGGKRTLADEIAEREAAAPRLGLTKDHPAYPSFVGTGRFPREDQSPLTATEKKAIFSAEDDETNLAGTEQALQRAKELNDKTFTGAGAGALGWAGTAIPGAGAVLDQEKASATREFGQLMSMESIKTMAETLKGATTDFELNKFVQILADPSTPPPIRQRTIDRMLQLAARKRQISRERVSGLSGGTYYKDRAAQGGAAPEAPTAPPKRLRYNPQTGALE